MTSEGVDPFEVMSANGLSVVTSEKAASAGVAASAMLPAKVATLIAALSGRRVNTSMLIPICIVESAKAEFRFVIPPPKDSTKVHTIDIDLECELYHGAVALNVTGGPLSVAPMLPAPAWAAPS